jgi:hypothetical protein
MALLTEGINTQTVTVATETVLATNGVNPDAVPAGTTVVVSGVVAIATGTGGTTVALKIRQSGVVGGAQVGPTFTFPAQTANSAQVCPFSWTDFAPLGTGQYIVTLTFTGNTSAVVNSNIVVQLDAGMLND